MHLEYKNQETKVSAADVRAENTQTNTVISKTSVTNSEELPGCGLQITDATGSAIVSWISGDKDSIKLNEKLEEITMMCKAEDDTFVSDEVILSISKRLTRQNKEAYEVLAKQVNPHQNRVDTAESMFGILPEDAYTEEVKTEGLRT